MTAYESAPASPGVKAQTRRVKAAARALLDRNGTGQGSPRLLLTLGLVLAAAFTLFPILLNDCLSMAAAVLFDEWPAWLDPALTAWNAALAVLIGVPLFAAVYRMAVLLTQKAEGEDVPAVTLLDVLYPFTSPRAWGRSLRVGLETLLWSALILGSPIAGGWLLDGLFFRVMPSDAPTGVEALMILLGVVVGLDLGFVFLLVSGRRMGYGYVVFAHPDDPLADCGRRFRSLGRPMRAALRFRLSYIGWILLSILCVCVPFLFHTIPYGMLGAAGYARSLSWRRDAS